MRPNKLLGNEFFSDIAEFLEEWSSLEVQIDAVTEADLLLALQDVGLRAEGELDCATAFLVAG